MNLNIENIIKQRLNLQSTERKLRSDFNLPANFSYFTSSSFLVLFKAWDKARQLYFAEIIGGKVNKNKTIEFLLGQNL